MKLDIPRISIVTPSFNQAAFIERTICSVLDQNHPNIEYIIIDGGSTDGSVEIIRRYEKYLAFWVSERDRGQSHAINKGLKIATGEWVAWQNSDDIFYPGTFESLVNAARKNSQSSLIIGNMNMIGEQGDVINDLKYITPTYESLLAEGMVLANQAAFWRRSIHEKVGFLNEDLHYGFDFEWFLRVLQNGRATHVNKTWGGLRMHSETKTSQFQVLFESDFAKILEGRQVSITKLRVYQLRRLFLMLAKGDLAYIVRGVRRRFFHK